MLGRRFTSCIVAAISPVAIAQEAPNFWHFPQLDFNPFDMNIVSRDGREMLGAIEGRASFISFFEIPRVLLPPPDFLQNRVVGVSSDGRFLGLNALLPVAGPNRSLAYIFDRTTLTYVYASQYPGAPSNYSVAKALSDDGQWLFGAVQVTEGPLDAARWSQNTGWQVFQQGSNAIICTACSPNGNWAGGNTNSLTPWRWSESTGLVDIVGLGISVVYDIANDGTMVGYSDRTATIWSPSGSRIPIVLPPDYTRSEAFAISSDARTIGIRARSAETENYEAFLWRDGTVYRLYNVLQSLGYPVSGRVFTAIYSISADGRWIQGYFAQQGRSAFVANIGPFLDNPTCDSIDFNNDASLFDPQDIEAFLSVYSEGPCVPASATCNDIDFNNDTSLFDPMDINAFLSVYSEGPCF